MTSPPLLATYCSHLNAKVIDLYNKIVDQKSLYHLVVLFYCMIHSIFFLYRHDLDIRKK